MEDKDTAVLDKEDDTDYENLNDKPEYSVEELLDEDEEDDGEDNPKDGKDGKAKKVEGDADGKPDAKTGQSPKVEVRDRSEDDPDKQEAKKEDEEPDLFSKDIKDIGEGRIGGQGIFFGDLDTTDLQGEFFTPETDLWLRGEGDMKSDEGMKINIPMIYGHGTADLKGSDAHIGVWDTVKSIDSGLWFEGQRDMSNRYADKIGRLIDEGIIACSSDSIARLVTRKKHPKGHGTVHELMSWPIAGISLTPKPAEPRLLPVTDTDAKAIVGETFDELIGRVAKRDRSRKATLLRLKIERSRDSL